MNLNFSEALALIAAGAMVILLMVVLQDTVAGSRSSAPVAAAQTSCGSVSKRSSYAPSNTAAHQSVSVLLPASTLQSVTVR